MSELKQKEEKQQQTHSCPIPACGVTLPTSKLMCSRHWHMLAGPLQLAVNVNYNRGGGVGTPGHVAAKNAAIEAVTAKATWRCAFCKRERPCELIALVTKQVSPDGYPERTLIEHMRYCKNNPACVERAQAWADAPKEGLPIGV